MKKTICILILLLAAGILWAESAEILEISGKVEIQAQGKDWKPARVGDIVAAGSMISTGFKSTAVLKISSSTITVKPITRLTLEQIIANEAGDQTNLFLLAGRVSAEVTPTAGKTTSFEVKSPTATASVRGTGFEFDGVNLVVSHGNVLMSLPNGTSRSVSQGEFTTVGSDGTVSPPTAASSGSGLESLETLMSDSEMGGGFSFAGDSGTLDKLSDTQKVSLTLYLE